MGKCRHCYKDVLHAFNGLCQVGGDHGYSYFCVARSASHRDPMGIKHLLHLGCKASIFIQMDFKSTVGQVRSGCMTAVSSTQNCNGNRHNGSLLLAICIVFLNLLKEKQFSCPYDTTCLAAGVNI